MADVMTGPCSWPLSFVGCSSTAALESLNDGDRAAVERSAIDYLWNWTGRRFGTCTEIVRPCVPGCVEGGSTFSGVGVGANRGGAGFLGTGATRVLTQVVQEGSGTPEIEEVGPGTYAVSEASDAPTSTARVTGYAQRLDYSCGGCGVEHGCDCSGASYSLRLPGPVSAVESVVIDGLELPRSAYRVDDASLLVRTDGGSWPTCQDFSRGVTQPNTWQVTYSRGEAVPEGGRIAAGLLAVEMARALCNDKGCQLPTRVQSIQRQGVSMVMLDGFEDLDKGHTGVWLIDSWVASMTKPARPAAAVFSVDVPRPRMRRTTWRAGQ